MSRSDYQRIQDTMRNLREAALTMEGFVPKFYEMDPRCEKLVYSYQLKPGMRVLAAHHGNRTDLRLECAMDAGAHRFNTLKYNRWSTVDSVDGFVQAGEARTAIITKYDDGSQQHFNVSRFDGWYVCSAQPVSAMLFQVPISEDPAAMADAIINMMREAGVNMDSDEFKDQMVQAAEFSSKIMEEILKPSEVNPDPIVLEEYDCEDGSTVRIDAGTEIPEGAIISTRRRIRQSDLDAVEKLKVDLDEVNIDTGEFVNRPGNIADGLDDADRVVKDRTGNATASNGGVANTGTIVGDMDVTAFKSDDPFAEVK